MNILISFTLKLADYKLNLLDTVAFEHENGLLCVF